MREFSENILESLNDGLAVVNRDDRIVRWNRRLEELYGIRHEQAVARRLDEIFEPGFLEVLRAARRESPEGAAFYRVPLVTRHDGAAARCSSTSRRRRCGIPTERSPGPS